MCFVSWFTLYIAAISLTSLGDIVVLIGTAEGISTRSVSIFHIVWQVSSIADEESSLAVSLIFLILPLRSTILNLFLFIVAEITGVIVVTAPAFVPSLYVIVRACVTVRSKWFGPP